MDKRLQAFLDGEMEREALPVDLLDEADRWGELDALVAEMRSETAPPWLETRVMASLPATLAQPWWQRAWQWIVQPQQVTVRPGSLALAGAAAIAGILAINAPDPVTVGPATVSNARTVANTGVPVIYVQFAFADKAAKSVTVAGDFNDWDAEATALRDTDGDGIWTGLIALRPGMHKYMFVVNGERWVTDPEAERYVDDGFGMRNAVIAITPPGRSI
jgi:hypothetical protein